jgi:hypothetical protein
VYWTMYFPAIISRRFFGITSTDLSDLSPMRQVDSTYQRNMCSSLQMQQVGQPRCRSSSRLVELVRLLQWSSCRTADPSLAKA